MPRNGKPADDGLVSDLATAVKMSLKEKALKADVVKIIAGDGIQLDVAGDGTVTISVKDWARISA